MKRSISANMQMLLVATLLIGGSAEPALAYFHPDEGRWISRDPMTEKGGANIYCFADNSPWSKVDPLGLLTWLHNGYSCTGGEGKPSIASQLGLSVQQLDFINTQKGITVANPSSGQNIWSILSSGFQATEMLLARLAYAEGTSGNQNDKYGIVSVAGFRAAFSPTTPGYSSPYPHNITAVVYQNPGFDAVNNNAPKWQESAHPETLGSLAKVKEWNYSANAVLLLNTQGPLSTIDGATVFHSYSANPHMPAPGQISSIWNWAWTADIGSTHYFKIWPK